MRHYHCHLQSGGGALFIAGSALLAANRFTGNSAPIGGAVFTYGAINTAFCGGDRFISNAAQSKVSRLHAERVYKQVFIAGLRRFRKHSVHGLCEC